MTYWISKNFDSIIVTKIKTYRKQVKSCHWLQFLIYTNAEFFLSNRVNIQKLFGFQKLVHMLSHLFFNLRKCVSLIVKMSDKRVCHHRPRFHERIESACILRKTVGWLNNVNNDLTRKLNDYLIVKCYSLSFWVTLH